MEVKNEIILYHPDDATVWLTQTQMCVLFQRDRTVITKHINNIFKEGELDLKSNVQKMHFANSDKPVSFYNLDVIISVGYRIKSTRGTQFRIWAREIIKNYLLNGYVINQRFERLDINRHNAQEIPISVKISTSVHDRFLLIDNEIYHIGASLKDLGKKLFAFSKMQMSSKELLRNIVA
jgi:hypothetical protein